MKILSRILLYTELQDSGLQCHSLDCVILLLICYPIITSVIDKASLNNISTI